MKTINLIINDKFDRTLTEIAKVLKKDRAETIRMCVALMDLVVCERNRGLDKIILCDSKAEMEAPVVYKEVVIPFGKKGK